MPMFLMVRRVVSGYPWYYPATAIIITDITNANVFDGRLYLASSRWDFARAISKMLVKI